MARVVHFEIPVDDPKRAAAFYKNVFDWEIEKWDGPMEYWLASTGNPKSPGIDGGFLLRKSGNPMVVNTMDVEDLDAVIAKIETHGGEITVPKMAVPGVGWMAYFKDPEGNVHGLMQADDCAA